MLCYMLYVISIDNFIFYGFTYQNNGHFLIFYFDIFDILLNALRIVIFDLDISNILLILLFNITYKSYKYFTLEFVV